MFTVFEMERCAFNHHKLIPIFSQVRKIVKKRHVPKHVLNAGKEHATIKESKKRKEANARKHSKPGKVPYVAERDKHIIKEDE